MQPEQADPSFSQEAEQVVLGSLITSPPLIADMTNLIKPESFYYPAHETLMTALITLSDEGNPVEAMSLAQHLRDFGLLERIGGYEYIVRLYRMASPHNINYYASIVAEKATQRQLLAAHQRGIQAIHDGNGLTTQALVDATYRDLDTITETRVASEVQRAGHTLAATIDKVDTLSKSDGGVTGVPTGFYELDRLTYGLHGGQMVVVAARPGVGKSTLGLDFLRSAAIKHKIPSILFSLEMSTDEINMRLLSAEARVELSHIRSGKLDDSDWDAIGRHQESIAEAPLFYDDTASNTMPQIRQKCRRLKQRHGLGLVVIDYLQLMQGESKGESRQQVVSDISRSIKLLAKELDVPVVAMSQLNRGSENRTDPTPKISDLRESGSIEQDADVVMLIHREDMYDPESTRTGEADVIIAKQRSAATGTAVMGFQGQLSRFVDLAG